ncbi:type VI secretion system Vgr family protein [Flavobacterium chungangense]|uniref:Type IV secretion protein Rhs n=2 Tax=Flavobacterium chungangense TaxID=554283 RepID=A0A6V6YUU8_9FLAO|nr:phage baseplate assembly protein V [Flavobacterium chungangense]CAD0003069.1 type IV secretion protein Rhs [Flavobacterium chungangense]
MKKSRTYQQRGMNDIVLDILAEGPGEFYERDAIKSTYLQEFKYMAQYNETNFDFLKRLARRYGQWFYFDGMRMQFGQTKTSKIKLINGSSLHGFKIQTNMASHKISLGGYDYNGAANIRNSSARTSSGSKDSFSAVVGHNQGTVTQNDLNNGAYTTNAQSSEEIEEMVKLQTAGSDANSVYYSGTSYFPLGLGQVFSIVNQTVEHELIVTEVSHISQVHGNYSCNFKAIPADVAAPHFTDVNVFAKAETQPAKVKDNNDPEGLGRVKVQFNWAGGNNSSEWLRMIQPHSGSGKGFYFIPEIGEEVLVGFEGSNAQNPYVLGTHYNGIESSGYSSGGNDQKVIHTRSGTKMVFNDAEGSILIEDPSGNTYQMDGKGNINVNAPNRISFNCTDMDINVSNNLSTSVGVNKTETVGVDAIETIGGIKTEVVTGNKNSTIAGNFIERVEGNLESHTVKELIFNGDKDVVISSVEEFTKHSQKQIIHNSSEPSNFY